MRPLWQRKIYHTEIPTTPEGVFPTKLSSSNIQAGLCFVAIKKYIKQTTAIYPQWITNTMPVAKLSVGI